MKRRKALKRGLSLMLKVLSTWDEELKSTTSIRCFKKGRKKRSEIEFLSTLKTFSVGDDGEERKLLSALMNNQWNLMDLKIDSMLCFWNSKVSKSMNPHFVRSHLPPSGPLTFESHDLLPAMMMLKSDSIIPLLCAIFVFFLFQDEIEFEGKNSRTRIPGVEGEAKVNLNVFSGWCPAGRRLNGTFFCLFKKICLNRNFFYSQRIRLYFEWKLNTACCGRKVFYYLRNGL